MRTQSIRTYLQNNRIIPYAFALLFLGISFIAAVSIGTAAISPKEIVSALFGGHAASDANQNILMSIRFPRVILAGLVGASLSLAGAAFQGLLRNPLADPYTLGVSSGASLGAVCVIYFGIHVFGNFTLPVISIASGFATMLGVLGFAYIAQRRTSMETMILAGVIFNSFLGSFISLIIALSGEELRQVMNWLLGSVSMRGWPYVQMILPFTILGAIVLLMHTRELNAFSFGEDRARHIGVNVKRKQLMIVISASMLTGSAVAVSGTIGFAGLVIPHMTRFLFGSDHRHLLPLSMIIGGGFLILADLLARTLITPVELPIGIITAIAGAPVFAFILAAKKRRS
ncbi:iron ABC transporter permease [Bacillus sp. FJAT-42376]|uniref:FecCD family ABC transporter permease n=1 Tax=Bacillus sp. FJAT-42376 TaxID=2014076 RepID=UPI000F4D6B78|nr:iron ABC transporter permease [Bacillus sp. FJAT-42376]AZB42674.1 iron ABC transporter permease [Bacillus sp. FJAT-42376]